MAWPDNSGDVFSSEQETEPTKAATWQAEPRANSDPINGPAMLCAKPEQRGKLGYLQDPRSDLTE